MTDTPTVPQRPPLVRPAEGRVVAGVCAGLARHLGWSVGMVRLILVVATVAGGSGALLYAWLWVFVPADSGDAILDPDTVVPPARRWSPPGRASGRPIPATLVVGLALVAGALFLAALAAGVRLPTGMLGTLVPVAVVGAGVVLGWSRLDEEQRDRWRSGGRTATVLRLGGGVVLVTAGLVGFIVLRSDLSGVWRAFAAGLAVLAGVILVLAPWGLRLWQDLGHEREARAREATRAEFAAHLHDSVLQTLTLIRRRADSPDDVARLARAQERQLRSWLYGDARTDSATVSTVLHQLAADAEDLYNVTVDVVVVGDAPVEGDPAVEALTAASREALTNAARHAGGTISLYAEVSATLAEVFVRDRGPGFEAADVPADRAGIRESIMGRMERNGGTATIASTPGEGTEVHLSMPRDGHGDEEPDDRAARSTPAGDPTTTQETPRS